MRNKLIHESNYIILHFFLSFFFIEKRSSEGQKAKTNKANYRLYKVPVSSAKMGMLMIMEKLKKKKIMEEIVNDHPF